MDERIEPLPEVDLNQEAVKFGAHYNKTRLKGTDMVANTLALNAAVHGFFAGVRWFERYQLGLNPPPPTGAQPTQPEVKDP